MSDLVAEHLDHLHYLNDILCLNISDLNKVLSEHLLHKLLVPLYVYSLMKYKKVSCQTQVKRSNVLVSFSTFTYIVINNLNFLKDERKHVSVVVALFLLSQVFLIVSHGPLVHTLAVIMLMSDLETIQTGTNMVLEKLKDITTSNKSVNFILSKETLEKSLETLNETLPISEVSCNKESDVKNIKELVVSAIDESQEFNHPSTSSNAASTVNIPVLINKPINRNIPHEEDLEEIKQLNVTDEEKEQRLALESPLISHQNQSDLFESLGKKPFLETIISSLLCAENDYAALFALCLLYALANNRVSITNF